MVTSVNGEYVLVLLTPEAERAGRDYDPAVDVEFTADELQRYQDSLAEQLALEGKYPASGLYRNDGSTDMLWPIAYISTCDEIFVANDGKHVATVNDPWSTCSGGGNIADFYARGRRFASVTDITFLPCTTLRMLAWRWFRVELPDFETVGIDDGAGALTIHTTQDEWFVFDVTTGELVRRRSPWPFVFYGPAAIGLLGLALRPWLRRRPTAARTIDEDRRPAGRFRFSLREMLGLAALVAGVIVLRDAFGPVAGTTALLAAIGAVVARVRSGIARGWLVGAVAALFGAYLAVVLMGTIDDRVINTPGFSRYWWDDSPGFRLRITIVAAAAISAAWFAGRAAERAAAAPS
jgi:hypothetical protein